MSIAKGTCILSIFLTISIFFTSCISPSATTPTKTVDISPHPTNPTHTAPSPTLTPSTSTSPVFGVRFVYFVDGPLMLQDGERPPIQLTRGSKDLYPTFSQDGDNIIFLRGLVPRDLFSVTLTGEERPLVSGDLLSALGSPYTHLSEIRNFAIVPGTPQVLFNTRQLGEMDVQAQDPNRNASTNNNDLLIVNSNTGDIKILLAAGKGGNFVVSPDGSKVALQANGRIDLVDINGQLLHSSLLTYTPTTPYELVPQMYWVEDSSELIITLPININYAMDGPEPRTVWRYVVDDQSVEQLSLSAPVLDDFTISPNGNWALYNYYFYPGKTDNTIPTGLYLANLREGDSQLYSPGVAESSWNPGSSHFLYQGEGGGISLGTPAGQTIPIDEKGRILGWMDKNHFLYFYDDSGSIMMGEIGGNIIEIPSSVPASSLRNGAAAFSFATRNP